MNCFTDGVHKNITELKILRTELKTGLDLLEQRFPGGSIGQLVLGA